MGKTTRIFITLADIKQLYNCSDSTASRKLRTIRDSCEKLPHQRDVTIKEFCSFYNLNFEEISQQLDL